MAPNHPYPGWVIVYLNWLWQTHLARKRLAKGQGTARRIRSFKDTNQFVAKLRSTVLFAEGEEAEGHGRIRGLRKQKYYPGQLRKLETWKDPKPGIGLNLNRYMHAPLMAQGAFDWPAYPNEKSCSVV